MFSAPNQYRKIAPWRFTGGSRGVVSSVTVHPARHWAGVTKLGTDSFNRWGEPLGHFWPNASKDKRRTRRRHSHKDRVQRSTVASLYCRRASRGDRWTVCGSRGSLSNGRRCEPGDGAAQHHEQTGQDDGVACQYPQGELTRVNVSRQTREAVMATVFLGFTMPYLGTQYDTPFHFSSNSVAL